MPRGKRKGSSGSREDAKRRREAARTRRQQETDEMRAARLQDNRVRIQARRESETKEERNARLQDLRRRTNSRRVAQAKRSSLNNQEARMSAVEKVAATAAFSSSSTIGQSNSARMSTTKLSPLHVSLNANTNLVEHGFSDNNSDGNSEFEEALKNIKALNGQGRYTDTTENEAIEKSLDSNFGIKQDNKSSSIDINKNTSESQKQSDDQNLNQSVSQENVNNSSHMNLSPIDTTQTSPLSENYDNPENLDDVKNNCDKSKTSKDEASDNEETEVNINHLNSLNVSSDKTDKKNCNDNENHSEKKNFVGNGDYSGSDVKEFVSSYGLDEKIKDSFKYFSEKNSNSALSKMLLKKKDDSNVQNVTSTSDSQSSSKSNKTSSSRGNLFENFGTIASTNHNDDKEDEKIKEIDEYISKSNGQVDSSVSAPLQSEEPDKDVSTSDKDDIEISKDVSNSGQKEEADLDNDNCKEVDSNSERLSKTPSPLQFSTNNSNEDLSSVTKSHEISESCENNDKKRSAEETDEWTDAEIAPVKRSRLDDVIGNLGSRIGIKLDSIPFVDELEESSKDSDSSEKPSEDSVTTDEEDDQEKTSNSDQKYIKISEKELTEIVKREVINVLNTKETTLEDLQVKIDELQATNEYWKTQAKELHKEVLELTVLQQKQEKRKAAAIALKAITARHVAVQVDEGKTSQNPSSTKTVKITAQKKSIQSPSSSLSFSSSSSSSISATVAVSANLGISENSSSHWSRAITTQDTIQSNLVAQPTVTSGLLSNNTPLAVFKKKIPPPNNQSKNGQVSSQLTTPVTKYQSTTVKSLLDASRNTNLNQVSTSPAVVYQPSGLIVVSPPTPTATTTTTTTTTTTRSILTKPVTSQVPTGAVKLIDLTGDDEAPFKNQANGKNVVHTAAIAPMGSVRSNIVSQQVVRQVTPVQQPKVPFGTSFLLSTPAGTQIISPTVTQGVGATKPGVCQYVLTSAPNIRPGSLVTVVPTTGTQNSSVRPPIVSSTVANAGSLPQLRPAQQSTAVSSVDLTKAIRPPPPLQSAPVQQNTQTTHERKRRLARERQRRRRSGLSQEQLEARREISRQRYSSATQQRANAIRTQSRMRESLKRQNETEEERTLRRADLRKRASQRIKKETVKERNSRRADMRERQSRKVQQESEDERNRRRSLNAQAMKNRRNRQIRNRVVSTLLSTSSSTTPAAKHPAPLPSQPTPTITSTGLKNPPPKAGLRISRVAQGIVLSWNMALNENHADISNYQLYAYQEGSAPPSTSLWKKVGDIKALPLPMACTLTQFHEGNKYHFAVRAVDSHGRVGPFSDPSTINLGVGNK